MARMMYLAGPIDYASDVEPSWREDAHEYILKEVDWILYDPSRAFTLGDDVEPSRQIWQINQAALGRASALIAFLPDGVRTIGTIEEITTAHHQGIPAAIVSDAWFDKSWSLAHVPRFRRIDEALSFLIGTAYNRANIHDQAFNMKVKRLHDGAILPTRAHDDDAGWDLYACEDVEVPPGKLVDIPVGIAIEPPPGYWYRIVGRSSTFRKRGLMMIEGIIDEGYRGPLYFGAFNVGQEPVTVQAGERLCQAIPQRTQDHLGAEWVESLTPSNRGEGGFGSTGS